MTSIYFRRAYEEFRRNGIIKDQREFTAMLGLNEQWLHGLIRKRSHRMRVDEKIVLRFRHRLDRFEQTAPRPLKPMFKALQERLRVAEAVAAENWNAVHDRGVGASRAAMS